MAAVHAGLRGPTDRLLPALGPGPSPSLPVLLPLEVPPLTARFVEAAFGEVVADRSHANALDTPRGQESGGVGPVVDSGRARLANVSGAAHDLRSNAYVVGSLPFTARTTSVGAAREEDEPSSCAPTGATVWFRHRAATERGLIASTLGSSGATALAVFREEAGYLVGVGCDVDAAGNAIVAFHGRAGATYLFQVTDTLGGASLVFNLDRSGATQRVSNVAGHPASSDAPSVSDDGRFIAYRLTPESSAPAHLHPGVYVTDALLGTTELVSLRHDGSPSTWQPWSPTISGDGRYVAWFSTDPHIVPGDANGYEDLFVRDRVTRTTFRATVDSRGRQGWLPLTGGPDEPGNNTQHDWLEPSAAFSADGRSLAFTSELAGLVPGDEPGCTSSNVASTNPPDAPPQANVPADAPGARCRDVFVRDLVAGTTTRVSVATDGTPGNGDHSTVDITPDGRFVLFASGSDNLVAGDTNLARDVFLHDRDADGDGRFDERGAIATQRVSVRWDGGQASGNSGGHGHAGHASVSADGRRVAFVSDAADLVPGDANGVADAFVRDLDARTTVLVSAAQFDDGTHTATNGSAHHAVLSHDGRYVVFNSDVSRPESARRRHVQLHDLVTRTTLLVSVSSEGHDADADSVEPFLSGDGRVVVFVSYAHNLAGGRHPSCPGTGAMVVGTPGRCANVFLHRLEASA